MFTELTTGLFYCVRNLRRPAVNISEIYNNSDISEDENDDFYVDDDMVDPDLAVVDESESGKSKA